METLYWCNVLMTMLEKQNPMSVDKTLNSYQITTDENEYDTSVAPSVIGIPGQFPVISNAQYQSYCDCV
jgi:hypothetical protein